MQTASVLAGDANESKDSVAARREWTSPAAKTSVFVHPTFQIGIRAFRTVEKSTTPARLVWVAEKTPKILIVEETSAGASEIQNALHECIQATFTHADFEHSSSALAQIEPDLVFVRLSPVRQQAFNFCKNIRQSSTVPIVIYGDQEDEFDELMSLELGADEFIPITRSPRVVGARINALLRRIVREQKEAAPVTGGGNPLSDLSIDRFGHAAYYRGNILDLPAAQSGLLAILAERPGTIVTNGELSERLKSWAVASDRKAIRMRMSRINAVLKVATEGKLFIKNQSRAGYALCFTECDYAQSASALLANSL